MTANEGMSEAEAVALAARVRREPGLTVSVESNDDYFVVEVEAVSGRWTLYDEADWASWRPRVLGDA